MRVPVIINKPLTSTGNITFLDKIKTYEHEAFFYIEAICNAWFTFEITVRFTVRKWLI